MQATTDTPLLTEIDSMLVGILVDVSDSMTAPIQSKGTAKNRLEGFRDALEGLIRAYGASTPGSTTARNAGQAAFFAYGFGFGNPLAQFMGRVGSQVQDLLALPNQSNSTIELSKLAKDWARYKAHIDDLTKEMFGSTPMGQAIRTAHQRISRESFRFRAERVLFLLSAGEPTDFSGEEVISLADKLKESGVLVISCYLTEEDGAGIRQLYGETKEGWSSAAKLLFECASPLPANSAFEKCLREFGWRIDRGGRLFAQIRQTELLAEFMKVILSPLQSGMPATHTQPTVPVVGNAKPEIQETEPEMPPPLLPTLPSPPRVKSQPLADPPPLIPDRGLIPPLPPPAGSEPYLPVWREDRIKAKVNWSAWIFGGVLLLILVGMLLFLHK